MKNLNAIQVTLLVIFLSLNLSSATYLLRLLPWMHPSGSVSTKGEVKVTGQGGSISHGGGVSVSHDHPSHSSSISSQGSVKVNPSHPQGSVGLRGSLSHSHPPPQDHGVGVGFSKSVSFGHGRSLKSNPSQEDVPNDNNQAPVKNNPSHDCGGGGGLGNGVGGGGGGGGRSGFGVGGSASFQGSLNNNNQGNGKDSPSSSGGGGGGSASFQGSANNNPSQSNGQINNQGNVKSNPSSSGGGSGSGSASFQGSANNNPSQSNGPSNNQGDGKDNPSPSGGGGSASFQGSANNNPSQSNGPSNSDGKDNPSPSNSGGSASFQGSANNNPSQSNGPSNNQGVGKDNPSPSGNSGGGSASFQGSANNNPSESNDQISNQGNVKSNPPPSGGGGSVGSQGSLKSGNSQFEGSVSSQGSEKTGNSQFEASVTFQGSFKKVYAFGDSFTDTGNAQLLGGLKSFVGAFLSKVASYAVNGSGQSGSLKGSRLSNGRLVIDYLCQSLGIPPLPAFKDSTANFSTGVNFAIAGSTALSNDFYAAHKIAHALMWKAIPETFKTQLDWFNQYVNNVECKGKNDFECQGSLNSSLFWVGEMGGNDYSRTLGSSVSIPWLTEMTISNVRMLVKTLIEKGAKYIVVQGLPPAGCCPLQLALSVLHARDNMGCASVANALIKAHNNLLQRKLEELRKLYPHCVISYVDYWSAYTTILSNPKKYNFEEPFKACCGSGGGNFNFDLHRLCGSAGTSTCKNPDNYINWDGVHLTEAMHQNLANLFFNQQGYCQPSFSQLVKQKNGQAHK